MAGAESGMSGAGIPQQPQPQPPVAAAGPADESSDSEGEHEGPQKLIRKVSTSGQIRSKLYSFLPDVLGSFMWVTLLTNIVLPQSCRSVKVKKETTKDEWECGKQYRRQLAYHFLPLAFWQEEEDAITNSGVPKDNLDPALEKSHSTKERTSCLERLLQSHYIENLSEVTEMNQHVVASLLYLKEEKIVWTLILCPSARPCTWVRQPKYEYRLGEEVIKSSSAEKDFGIVVDEKLDMNQWYALAAWRAKCILGCIKRGVASRSREVILSLYPCETPPGVLHPGATTMADGLSLGQWQTSIKEGLLLKQTSSFQRWKKRYFKLRGRTLYYAKDSKSLIFDEVDLSDASVAESSTKNVNNSFTIITPFRRLILCAENRKEMEDWISSLKSVQSREHYEGTFSPSSLWQRLIKLIAGHPEDIPLNFVEASVEKDVCKFKAHKRCAVRATNNCKWTTLASIGKDIIEDEDGIAMPHQWLEGNLPVSAKCAVCDKTCGSVLRLQDWKCLWCKAMVHTACKDLYPRKCPLGQCKVSIIPPTALNSIDSDGFWKATCPPSCASPLLVFVNSKSGDNQGVKFLRRFKQSLNPAQVFDLMNGGPHLGLRLFQKFDNFRILVCGGDGSCQLGVLPLGTGNDLARVLGWGGSCDDDTQLPQILEKLERASTKMLDRWSIMSYELKLPAKPSILPATAEESEECQISAYEDSVAAHLAKILNSDQHSVVISSAKILCETVKDFVAKIGKTYEKPMENAEEADAMAIKCSELNEKLDLLLQALHTEAQAAPILPGIAPPIVEEEAEEFSSEESFSEIKEQLVECVSKSSTQKFFKPREQLMLRANSLKKAVRQIIEQAEKAVVDEQNAHSEEQVNQSPVEYSKELDESKEEEKEEDTKELESPSSEKIRNEIKICSVLIVAFGA
ncbi:Diacylglycerol kinase eta [Pitangus sulphuratus]|nr:Diacylglycerol kinase eta [Pitangus sulphuratus]